MKFFVSCGKGLEYLLADELLALGVARATAANAGVNAEGGLLDAQRAVLWSRLASRVLWPLSEFECPDEAALYAGAASIDWPAHLDPTLTIAVDAHVSGDKLTHAQYAALRVKDAIVDVMRQATGERPSVNTHAPDVLVNLAVRKGRATLSIDLGGAALHRRGWRTQQNEAPLKETLAAAVLLRAQWPQVYADGGALLDPMCGAGTLLIEGALMAADVAPGLERSNLRRPSRWFGFDKDGWDALVVQARGRADAGLEALRPVVFGSDLDPHAIHAARSNAIAAGVVRAVSLDVRDVAALPVLPFARGSVVCNPPYDERLAADDALYRRLGDALKRAVPGWRASILCGDPQLAFATGLRATKKYQLFNGALECALIVVDPLVDPALAKREAAPLPALSDGATMVANRLRKNLKKLKPWLARESVQAYRAYDADLPEYSAAVDVYLGRPEGSVVDTETWLHVQEYAAPEEIPEADVRRRRGELLAAVQEVFAVPAERIALKTRTKGKGGSKYAREVPVLRGDFLQVEEGGAKLRVNLFDYLDTGLFLDHRPLRARIAREVRGLKMLNLFCYTGAFSVQAAVGGAASTTSVDLSATYLDWAAKNLAMNGFGGVDHKLVQGDVVRWLDAERHRFDLIFCDPPTFSNSARADDFDVQRDHVRLLRAAVDRLATNGVIYFSNNFRRFKMDLDSLAEFAVVEDISEATIPVDFSRNPKIHKAWRIRRLLDVAAG